MKLPSPTEMDLLMALGLREVSGRDLAKQFQKETGRSIAYGTLYTAMRRLKESGWVESRDDEESDGRARYFKLSGAAARALPLLKRMEGFFGLEVQV